MMLIEDSGFVEYDAVSAGKYLLRFGWGGS
jgi:hypothetical protein